MSERTVLHDTNLIERNFDASPARVFAAWADPVAHGRWNVPGNGWEVAEYHHDFRVGGREFSRVSADRKQGWGEILGKLDAELRRQSATA